MNREIKIIDNLIRFRNEDNKFQPEDILTIEDVWLLLDYIINLQERVDRIDLVNCKLRKENDRLKEILHWKQIENNIFYKSRNEKAIEYITSYESISTIQGLDKIEQNKTLDEKTMNIMVYRYLEVHDKLLKILKGSDEE